jgi:carboxymethylenebutenolidase
MGALKRFPVGDLSVRGYLAAPETGKGPGVLVLHAWWGLNPFCKSFCDRLAGEGFVAFAPDLYSGAVAKTIDEARQLRRKLNRPFAQKQIVAALETLRKQKAVSGPSVALVGFSLGAHFALGLALAKPKDIAAVTLFYGAGGGGASVKSQAAFLGHFAEDDPYEPAARVEKLEAKLRAAGRPVEFYTYPGTAHWFFESDQPSAYDAKAAQQAWQRTVKFLRAWL